jgi:hypothetical protein
VTDKGRWWVITNLTNLYSQTHFPSLDYTLSFHIGLMTRLRSRDSDSREPDPFNEVFRRRDQAEERRERAIEAEDFQAVGLALRECLLALIGGLRRRTNLRGDQSYPKEADFASWFELLMDELCGGESKKALRQYMKLVGKETWQLVNWLTHHRNANAASSIIASQACSTLIGHSIQLFDDHLPNRVEHCPHCRSRNVRSHFDHRIEPDGQYFWTCGACGWSNHPTAANLG